MMRVSLDIAMQHPDRTICFFFSIGMLICSAAKMEYTDETNNWISYIQHWNWNMICMSIDIDERYLQIFYRFAKIHIF